jgi:ABC-type multidrug transport system fused ATPase/permease subunit
LYSLIWSLVKPYRASLAVVFVAMMLQMAATVAAPWPLKIVLDNVVGEHKLPHWLSELLQPFFHHGTKMEIAAAAAIGLVVIAVIGAIA